MDENTRKAIHNLSEEIERFGSVLIERFGSVLSEALIEAVNALRDAFPEFKDGCENIVAGLAGFVDKAMKAIRNRERERRKWRKAPNAPIFQLLLDKRKRVHRCRNNC